MTCPTCSADLASDARFCGQCGTSLAGLCASCGHSNNPGARFCSQCGSKVEAGETNAPDVVEESSGSDPLPYAERRQLTVLFSDLIGSTALSEQLDPEDLRAILRDYQAACTSVVTLYDGTLAKYLGDGVLAYFGYPTAHEEDARRGLQAGLGIIEAMKSLSDRYREQIGADVGVRVGVHTGLVVVGDMDTDDVLESNAVVGKTPNMAARIQSLAEPNTLYLSDSTYRLVGGYFECIDMGRQELKGISQPVHIYRAVHESTARSRLEATSSHLTPFTGRVDEMAQVAERWKRAEKGEREVLLLGGEPGVGKSRMTLAIKEMVSQNEDAWLTELRCTPFHKNSALYPAIDFLERVVLRFEREETAEERMKKIEGLAAQYALDMEEGPVLLASLLSVPPREGTPPLNLTPQKQKEKTIDLLISILLERASRQPVLFILEDLHWADPSTLQLIDRFFEMSSQSRVMIILTYRPEFQPYWNRDERMLRIDLQGFSKNHGETIIRETAGGKTLPDEVIAYIIEKTDGVPLFLEELTRSLIDSDRLTETDGVYELTRPLDSVSVPSTLQDSLTARLDRLAEGKRLAQLAATVGREFSYEMVDAIPGPHRNNLDHELSRLVNAGILFRKGHAEHATYLFQHALIQDAAYSSLLKSTRKEHHTIIADAMEKNYPELIETQPEILAHHYSEGGNHAKAIDYWLKAGMRALQRSANIEAIAQLERGLDLVEKMPEGPEHSALELGLLTMQATALIATHGFAADVVGANVEKIAALCEEMGDTPQLFPSLWVQWVYTLVRDRLQASRDIATRMLRMGEEADESRMIIEGAWTLGNSLFWLGELSETRDSLERAVALYDPEVHHLNAYHYGQDPGVAALCYLNYTTLHQGDMKRMFEVEKESLERASSLRHPFTKGWALSFAMMRVMWSGNPELALPRAEGVIAFCTEQSYPFWLFAGISIKGWSLVMKGEIEEGLATLEQGLAGWDMIGSIICKAIFLGLQGEAFGVVGRHEEAVEVLDEAIRLAREHTEIMSEIDLYRPRGLSLIALDRRDEGITSLRHGCRMARDYDSRLLDLKVTLALIEVIGPEEDPEETEHLRELLEQYDKGCEIPAYDRGRELLG